jgi:hypothetical protein
MPNNYIPEEMLEMKNNLNLENMENFIQNDSLSQVLDTAEDNNSTFTEKDDEKSHQVSDKERTVGVYLQMEAMNFRAKNQFEMNGKQKRQVRRKLEKMYEQGKLKLTDLNE